MAQSPRPIEVSIRQGRRKPMSSPSLHHSVYSDIEYAVCLLALVVNRPPPPNEVAADPVSESKGDGVEEIEDLQNINVEGDGQQHLFELRSKVLDRLAETLARFKSDPHSDPKGITLRDAKHVSSAAMIVYTEQEKVKVLCSKNEGLDKEDEIFLGNWKTCMEAIAKTGTASEESKTAMFDLVFEHQKPRILTYLRWLKRAFQSEQSTVYNPSMPKDALLESRMQSQLLLTSREWVDDSGNVFEIPINMAAEAHEVSEAVLTGESFRDLDAGVSELSDIIDILCRKKRSQKSRNILLKRLMRIAFDLWKGARTQSAVRAHLRRRFQERGKQRKEAENALIFLCKIYAGVQTFIEAAERLPTFKSIQYASIVYQEPRPKNDTKLNPPRPLDVVKSLGIVSRPEWNDYLDQEGSRFTTLLNEKRSKRHFHAEIQMLQHHDFVLSPDERKHIHPYIGCSRRCCFLCYFFVLMYRGFGVRGTHETIIHRWDIPEMMAGGKGSSTTNFSSAAHRLLDILKSGLHQLFNMPYPVSPRQLLAQSSKALSSAQIVLDKELAKFEKSHREFEQMAMMPIAFNDAMLINRIPDRPEYAYVVGGQLPKGGKEMTMGDAEMLKANLIRTKLGLEPLGEMPPTCISSSRRSCRLCKRPSNFRCSACRMYYCSRSCQAKDWKKRHLFVCCVKGRPNDVDFLHIITRQWLLAQADSRFSRSGLLMALFSHDDLCETFGFNSCATMDEVNNLMCIYGDLIRRIGSVALQEHVNSQTLGPLIESWISAEHLHGSAGERIYSCFVWFISSRFTGFEIPNHGGDYAYQEYAVFEIHRCFSLPIDAKPLKALTRSETTVANLYLILLRDFNNIPGAHNVEWIEFGFCYCTNVAQRKALVAAYLDLAKNGTTLAQIAKAWETSSLPHLMKSQRIDISILESAGISFQPPPVDDFGIYRFMGEVQHALSGRYCPCFRSAGCPFHSKYETLLSKETEGDYGFHGANPWERWQLLNFYSHIFSNPNFDPRKMQQARRDTSSEALEAYLDTLVPDFRRKIGNWYLADGMFPKLKTRLVFPRGRPRCECIIHTALVSRGLDLRTLGRVALMRGGDEEE